MQIEEYFPKRRELSAGYAVAHCRRHIRLCENFKQQLKFRKLICSQSEFRNRRHLLFFDSDPSTLHKMAGKRIRVLSEAIYNPPFAIIIRVNGAS